MIGLHLSDTQEYIAASNYKPLVLYVMRQKDFIEMALSFSGTEQKPHFDRIGFKIIGKRMFTTYLEENNTANVFLTPKGQKVFCRIVPENIRCSGHVLKKLIIIL